MAQALAIVMLVIKTSGCFRRGRECMAAFPTDEGTLNAVQHALRLCNKEEELGPFYESLLTKYPGSPGILSIIFNYHVRIGTEKNAKHGSEALQSDQRHQISVLVRREHAQQSDPTYDAYYRRKDLSKNIFPPSGNANEIESSSALRSQAQRR